MNTSFEADPSAPTDRVQDADEVIQQHSRSFSIASRLLPASVRDSVCHLYAWCRAADDCVDSTTCKEQAECELRQLESDLEKLSNGGNDLEHPASLWIAPLVANGSLDVQYAKELLVGMRMDIQGFQVTSDARLWQYSYHVAGTVGLMLSRLMGVQDITAKRHAIALGVAMQMTNIARDVREDALRGRCYLPGIESPLDTPREVLLNEILSLIEESERQYRVAELGLHYLPWRCRFAVRMAMSLYREIGREIRRRGYEVLEARIVISRSRILWVFFNAYLQFHVDQIVRALQQLPILSLGKIMTDTPSKNAVTNQTTVIEGRTVIEGNTGFEGSTVQQAKHAVYLGVSLTLIMAAALFVLVYVNPKEAAYSYLPLVYSAASLVGAFLFNRMAARCELAVGETPDQSW